MNELKVGDPVLLTLDSPGAVGITEGLKRYKDRRFRISRIVRVIPVNKLPGCRGCYYELEGCVSPKGVPYGITSDWMQKITEVRR